MKNKTLNLNGRLIYLDQPVVMGILNATPDSFYNQGQNSQPEALLKTANKMVSEGASMLDIGALSSRPGAKMISVEEEWQRLAKAVQLIRKAFPKIIFSVDTFRAEIAKRAAMEGIDLINDISAGDMDKDMLKTVAALNLPYIAMHMQGRPQTMQIQPQYTNVVREIIDYFIQKITAIGQAGIKDVIIDPGFGFGKTIAQNYQLLTALHQFSILDKPILAGLSRKSMIYKVLGNTPEEALNATTALNMLALQNGADILRVHDVKEAVACVQLWEYAKISAIEPVCELKLK